MHALLSGHSMQCSTEVNINEHPCHKNILQSEGSETPNMCGQEHQYKKGIMGHMCDV